jgi:hypothetical protein
MSAVSLAPATQALAERARSFASVVQTQVNQAQAYPSNNGRLTEPLNADNLMGAHWEAKMPALPANLSRRTSLTSGEPVQIDTRYSHGQSEGRLVVWIRGKKHPSKAFSLTFNVDPRTGRGLKSSLLNQAGSDLNGWERIHEQDVAVLMASLFSDLPEYENRPRGPRLRDAFCWGMNAKTDQGALPYWRQTAQKVFSVASRTGGALRGGGFDLTATRVRIGGELTSGVTVVELRRFFEPSDDVPFAGTLTQTLTVKSRADGSVEQMSRASAITVPNSNPKKAPIVLGTTEKPNDLPPSLRAQLYPSAQPTEADLRFFERLLTEPISPEDLSI